MVKKNPKRKTTTPRTKSKKTEEDAREIAKKDAEKKLEGELYNNFNTGYVCFVGGAFGLFTGGIGGYLLARILDGANFEGDAFTGGLIGGLATALLFNNSWKSYAFSKGWIHTTHFRWFYQKR